MSKTTDDILKAEISSIMNDIVALYEQSGKKVTEEFARGLSAGYKHNEATIRGYVYLAGRPAGKMPPVAAILEWVKNRGLKPRSGTVRNLAYAIAKKIGEEGTRKESVMKIYEQVITDARINEIVEKVSILNVNRIVDEIRIELEIFEKDV